MTINHVYKKIKKVMTILENVDMMSLDKRKYNQEQINKAYNVLDNFKDELIRENIKNKQKEVQKRWNT